jgi:hypothetical protein
LVLTRAPRWPQLLADGRPNGLSGDMHRAAADAGGSADACWLADAHACGSRGGGRAQAAPCARCGFATPRPDAARALGHLVNHRGGAANVPYRLVALRCADDPACCAASAAQETLPPELLRLLPSLNGGGLPASPRWGRARAPSPARGWRLTLARCLPASLRAGGGGARALRHRALRGAVRGLWQGPAQPGLPRLTRRAERRKL